MSNQNFPAMEHGWGAMWGANGGAVPIDGYIDVTERTTGGASTQAGRQYELDQVQSSTLNTALQNTDGLLDPTNASGPWYGHIAPYQPYRVRAQWPPTANMLSQSLAAAVGVPLGAVDSVATGFSGLTPTAVAAADAFGSSGVAYQVTVPTATGARVAFAWSTQVAVRPGQKYTFTAHVRNITASSSLSVEAALIWRDVTGANDTTAYGTASTLVGNASPSGWTTVTVTGTAPANAAGVYLAVLSPSATTAAYSVQTSGWQLEEGSTATAWGMPGTWYPIYSGFVERWPQTWTMAGSLGTIQPTAVDAFALLSQRQLTDVLTEEINRHNPRFVYLMNDPQGSDAASDATGNYPAAPVKSGKFGAASVTFGTEITATDPVNGIYSSTAGSVATFNNTNAGATYNGPTSYISLTSAGITGPISGTDGWQRMIAFRYTGPAITSSVHLWDMSDKTRVNQNIAGSLVQLGITSSGYTYFAVAGPTLSICTVTVPKRVDDGNWHLAIFSYSASANEIVLSVDGAQYFNTPTPTQLPVGLAMDSIGAFVDETTRGTNTSFAGDVALACEWAFNFTNSDRIAMYSAWKNAFAGDSTGMRYSRILKYAGYSGASNIATGDTSSMGPSDFSGTDALSALQAVVDTEGGEHFVDASGQIVFRARSARYNVSDPVYTFGEDVAAGEWPYEDCQTDHDPTHLGNIAQVTQSGTGAIYTAQDLASQAQYFPRTLQRTVNVTDPLEAQDAAAYLVSRYAQPQTRVSSLTLHPAAYPALWPVALSLGLGMRIRVNRRPPGRPPISIECFIESLAWSFSATGDATLALQCSPADTTPYGVFGAWHAALTANAPAGSTTITVDGNPAQLQAGYGLWLPSEGATVRSISGHVITLVAPTAFAYTAGEVISESLPDGFDDPTTWDGACVLDSVAFTY